jgi:hypothetical protein
MISFNVCAGVIQSYLSSFDNDIVDDDDDDDIYIDAIAGAHLMISYYL